MHVTKRLSSPVRRAAALLAVVLLPAAALAQTPLKVGDGDKDILVQVQETRTGSLMFGVGVNSDAGLTGSIVLNERNFDILRPPLKPGDCIWDGGDQGYGIWEVGGRVVYPPDKFREEMNARAFRGAGQEFRIEAVPGTQSQRFSAMFREAKKPDAPSSVLPSGFFSRPPTE
jgi:outer membrane protein insertion porin family